MKTHQVGIFILPVWIFCLAAPAHATDRVRPGKWVGATTIGQKVFPTSSCISQSDAAELNGDAKSVQAYLARLVPASICKISNVKAAGAEVVFTSTCAGRPPTVVTTMYHGTSSEGSDNTGSRTTGKLVGACK